MGIVRVHLQAPSAPWQAGTVSPAQQLVERPPPDFGTQPFVDHDQRLTLWNPERLNRRGMRDNVGFHRIPLDSLQSGACTAGLLVWPGQAVAAAEDADSQDGDEDT